MEDDTSQLKSLNNMNSSHMNSSQLKLITNTELIEMIESTGIDYIIQIKEALLRIGDGRFSNDEYQRFIGIGENTGIALLDLAPNATKYDAKKSITDAMSQVLDKAYDPTR